MDPVGTPYNGDALTPVFAWQASAFSWQEIIRILAYEHQPEKLCVQPPVNISNNVSFLIDNAKIKHESDIRCDDMGVWNCTGSPKLYLTLVYDLDGKANSARKCEEKPDALSSEFFVLKQSYFVNASSENCRKVISKLQGRMLFLLDIVCQ